MFTILMWIVFGLIVGMIAKVLHPGEEPSGCLPTVAIGIAGSFVGGGINWVIDRGETPFAASGFLMSIIGGIICCMIWRWWALKNSPEGPKSFFTGRRLK